MLEHRDLRLGAGEIVGLFGPTGAGKTTRGRALAGLSPGSAVLLDGAPLPRRGASPVQYLHQSPILALNPRWRIGRAIAEAGAPDPALAARIGVEPGWLDRYPHELSGGQLQRVAILRGLLARPRFLIADEVTASLDPVTQARIWHVLRQEARRGLGILTISHDRALLDRVADRTLDMKGRAIRKAPDRFSIREA